MAGYTLKKPMRYMRYITVTWPLHTLHLGIYVPLTYPFSATNTKVGTRTKELESADLTRREREPE